jgi:CheY-like chemotaxis protein
VSTILLADDNSNIQKMVALALKDQGIEVVAVGNGEAAVRKLRDMVPDLVLADIFMPVRTGYEVCEFVKGDARLSHVPVVLLAGAFDPFDQNEAERVGANGVLKKPFVPPDPLVNLVKSLLPKPPDPPPVDPRSGEFVSKKVTDTWGSPLPSQAFAGTSMPPGANAPYVAPVAVANPPGTQAGQPMASTSSATQTKPRVKEEFPEPIDDPSLTQVTRPELLDEMLGRSAEAKESHAPKGKFGGVAAFPDLVEGEGPKPPEKNKFAPKSAPPGSFGDRQFEGQDSAVEEDEEVEVERPKSFRPSFLDRVDEAVIETKSKKSEKSEKKGGIELPKGLNFPAPSDATAEAEKPAASASSKITWPSLDQALPPIPAAKTETKAEEAKVAEPVASAPVAFEPPKAEPVISHEEKSEETQQWDSYSSVAAEIDARESEKAEAQAGAPINVSPINVSPWLPRPTPTPEPAAKTETAEETIPAKPIVIPRGADQEILNTVKAVMEETAASVDNFGKTEPAASSSAPAEAETKVEAKAENVVAFTQAPAAQENAAASSEIAAPKAEKTTPIETAAAVETSVETTTAPKKSSTEQSSEIQSEHSNENPLGGAKDMATAENAAAGPVAATEKLATTAQEDELVSEISARVMERMRPQVIDVITKEILRPIVEALVKKEIEEK